MSNKKDDWADERVYEIMKELLNPEPHPFQEEWSDAHSMTSDTLMKRLKQALLQAKAEGMKEQLALTTRANTMNKAQKQSDQ